jgi:hypothetical protein
MDSVQQIAIAAGTTVRSDGMEARNLDPRCVIGVRVTALVEMALQR